MEFIIVSVAFVTVAATAGYWFTKHVLKLEME